MTTWARRALWAAFALALALQLVVLYLPSTPAGPGIPGFDKLVHAGIFLLPAALGVLLGLRIGWLVVVLAAHAVASELVQLTLLPERAGDVWDVVADLIGIALGVVVGLIARPGRRAPSAASRTPGA